MKQKNIIVVGNGMVGHKFCERLNAKDTAKVWNISVFGEEPRPAYDRVHLSEYFTGKTADDLLLGTKEWYAERGITLQLNQKITKIDKIEKTVTSDSGETYSYDILVLATGSTPFVPPIPGVDKKGVFVYRTIEDLEAIISHARDAKSAAVIGGGLLGLEAAKATKDLGLKSTVIEFAPRLMPRQLDEKGGTLLKDLIEKQDIDVYLNTATKCIEGDESVSGMTFQDGKQIDVDMIVVSAGIRPQDELARSSGLEVGERGGVVVNDNLLTSNPSIYAIGEVALHNNFIYGLVAPGYNMADIVSDQLLEKENSFSGSDMSTKLKLIGTDVASIGNIEPQTPHRNVVIDDPFSGIYKRLIICEETKLLLGAILVGEAESYGNLLQLYLNKMTLPDEPIALISKAGDASAGLSIGDLPDSAQICSCENVTKADICSAIENDGIDTVAELKKSTKACTGCGGCTPLVTQLLNHKLKEMGREVNTSLCEHFPYSRKELYDIVKISGISDFDTLIEKHGHGSGCEICKTTAANIFASIQNEPILNHAKLQDSNDAFLANIQKDGTYSVVPRVAGGEITADKLIAIGEIAKEFNLYVKITGGQRIDLLGAHLNDLPVIWEKLINHGFESGRAYGKSMRTVKTCVGSSWCRYGVQDSTSLGIKIEERYRGIRSPHKLKSAVSGCTRECAEAQSKDFGIIATENGWNLYLGGNGGMKPQHAQLFASDLDEETLIKYIDRFLMYYVNTADRLTRTASWLNQLEGGIAHLKEVIIEDKLGICEELDQQMEHLLNTYECEWKNTINDPEKLKRFSHFINTDEKDTNIVMATERQQIRPLYDHERKLCGCGTNGGCGNKS